LEGLSVARIVPQLVEPGLLLDAFFNASKAFFLSPARA
jgi:hypothetical protein